MNERHTGRFASTLISLLLLFLILICACETAFYLDYGWYLREYHKCGVPEDLEMTDEDLEGTTRYMMSYLRGDKEALSYETTVHGEYGDFFNEEERTHMADVQMLFVGALKLRRWALLAIAVIAVLSLLFRQRFYRSLPGVFLILEIIFVLLSGALVGLMSLDFSRAFIIFHKIFFYFDKENNWVLDLNTSNLIHMLPEQFFADMGIRIAVFFALYLALAFVAALIGKAVVRITRKENDI